MQVGWWKVLWWGKTGSHSYFHDNWWFKYAIFDDAGPTETAGKRRKRKAEEPKAEAKTEEPTSVKAKETKPLAPDISTSPPLRVVSSETLEALNRAIVRFETAVNLLRTQLERAATEQREAELREQLLVHLARLAMLQALMQQMEDEELLLLLV